MRYRAFCLGLATLVLAGCNYNRTPNFAVEAPRYRIPPDYRQKIVAWTKRYYIEPNSARILALSDPMPVLVTSGIPVWLVCVELDARERGGPYMGPRQSRSDFTRISRRLWSARSSTSRTRTVSIPRLLGGSGDAGQLLGRAGGDRDGGTRDTVRAIVCVLPPVRVRTLARYSPAMRDLLRRTKPTRQCKSSDGSFIERRVDHSLTAIMLRRSCTRSAQRRLAFGSSLRELRD